MDQKQSESLLAQTGLFSGLDRAALATIAAEGHERSFRRHASIFQEGDPGDAFHVIVEGSVKIFVTSARGEEMVLTTMRSPQTLGEVCLFDEGSRSASVEALEPVRLLSFARSSVLGLAARDPRIYESMLRGAGELLRRLTTQAADFVFLDLEGRVAKLLADTAESRGVPQGDRLALDLGLTQGEVGSMVGGSRQSVNQILHVFEARGLIEVDRVSLFVKDLPGLRRRASM